MRLFIAINLPDEVRKSIVEAQNSLRGLGDMKLVEEENIHITLLFLGEAKSSEDVAKNLEKTEFQPFDISMKGVGVFPNEKYVKVVWAGVDKGSAEITDLNKKVCVALGTKDDRFHPHATIARVKTLKKQDFLEFLRGNKEKEFGSFRADAFDLMESELTPKGPKYSIIRSFS